jgi:putative PEP-CTERM system histidine kinase
MTGNELTGFVVLAASRTATDVNWEVNDLLRTAGSQAATFLAQSLATEALLEARKFEAFNRMSAFVVHDLKNIVTQLSLMVRNAERHRDNPAFQKDMLMTVEHSVQRMNQLMLQLRQGAQPAEALSGIDLAHIIERIRDGKHAQGLEVEIGIGARPIVKGHHERVERVIGHLVQNAIDATARGGSVRVGLRQEGDQAVVEVMDTGEGMAPEFLQERLFKPFQTTKPGGMGVGAYESAQYVRELGGRINVESEMGVGTTITMLLPVLANAAGLAQAQEAIHG